MCSFCDQRSISGEQSAPTPEKVKTVLEEQAAHLTKRGNDGGDRVLRRQLYGYSARLYVGAPRDCNCLLYTSDADDEIVGV